MPDGPQLRLKVLQLDKVGKPGNPWAPCDIRIPVTFEAAQQPMKVAIGPMLDVTASDYAFVLVDGSVKVRCHVTSMHARTAEQSRARALTAVVLVDGSV